MKPIIRVENLSKEYRLGANQTPQMTFRETLMKIVKSPVKKISEKTLQRERASFWALKDINFEIMPGEVVGVIGRNGAGKSTLLKVLSRITEPTTGKVELYGRIGSLLEVGTGFHPELTGRENIFLNGAILGMRREEISRKFDEIVDFAEIEDFLDTAVKYYSSGMYTRLAFAVAANLKPEVLIVDEVLAVGDVEFQKKCIGKMDQVAKDGRTVIFVSHNMTTISNLCKKALFLESGKIKYNGSINGAIDLYLRTTNSSEAYFEGEVVKCASVKQEGNQIILTVSYETPKAITLPCLGFSIVDQMGNPICGSNPRYDRVPHLPQPTTKGKVKVSVTSPSLIDGTYGISIWFGSDTQNYFERKDCLSFEILNMISPQHPYPTAHGHVQPHCNWAFLDL